MPGLRSKAESALAHFFLDMPVGAQRRLAGRPVVRDGQTLAPETQLMLRLLRLVGDPDVATLPLAEGRRRMSEQAAMVGGRQPIGATRDLVVDGAEGPLPGRLYIPTGRLGSGLRPTMLFLHGGGMMYGDLDSHDAVCRFVAERSGVQLLAVDYRLAPEHPFPAAVDDCAAAYRWLVDHAADPAHDLRADRYRLAVGGDSAGGYLSATTAILAAEQDLPMAFQLLVYPCTDFVQRSRSRELFAEGFYLTDEFMDLAEQRYFAPGADRDGPLASIVRRKELPDGIAPAHVVTAGFDPLRDEGEAYADLLADQGVPVTRVRHQSMIHGFFNMVGVGHEPREYVAAIADRLAAALG
ncbi:MAG TPA: alpha/beta hydrolase [Marmoricola sp.]|nr:alpha/beta hydrolase [Marmoricola sp.]